MNSFLKETLKFKNLKNICFILGNESCDLDSAVSSISLAHYYTVKDNNVKSYDGFLPILNMQRNDFPLKTEVNYYFREHNIQIENLSFIDEFDKSIITMHDIILVDHHVSPYFSSVVKVFDHRPLDPSSKLNDSCHTIIEQVGSCATLIGNLFLELQVYKNYYYALEFVYGAIVLDTVNFSKEADKARELDLNVAHKIESILGIKDVSREIIFNNLVKARSDVTTLDSYQILFKDMKVVTNKSNMVKVSIPGYPILVQEYIKMKEADFNLKKFAKKQGVSVILLMGMKICGKEVERDLGLINISNSVLFDKILFDLKANTIVDLDLHQIEKVRFLDGEFFKQGNIKASRKQILPIVKDILDQI